VLSHSSSFPSNLFAVDGWMDESENAWTWKQESRGFKSNHSTVTGLHVCDSVYDSTFDFKYDLSANHIRIRFFISRQPNVYTFKQKINRQLYLGAVYT
jgi:hypothetical protein